MNDPTRLPAGLPVPRDDGAAAHLPGAAMPDLTLCATDGTAVSLAHLTGRTVIYAYPRTAQPGQPPFTEDWDSIPGARGCTPQSCSFRDRFEDLKALGVDNVFGLSTQRTDYQREVVERLHLPFPLLSDHRLTLTSALKLPTFEAGGSVLLKRLTMILDDGRVTHVLYPVFPPDKSAEAVADWLRANPQNMPQAGAA
jgi:peroxiredoxin